MNFLSQFWETLSDEHQINRCGHFYGNSLLPYQRLNVYYDYVQNSRFVPRCVICDLEPSQVYSLRCSAVGKLFNPEFCISGNRGAGNNWAKGFYTEGAELMDSVLECTRKQTEGCDCMQGFQMVHSIGGGSGAGMGSLLINRLHDDYPDRLINSFTVIPSGKVSETVVEPYNAVLSLKELICHTDETITFDNEALYDICEKTLRIPKPLLSDLNYLISTAMAGVTACFRYPGQLNTDLRKLMVNMCPYPRLKFFIPGYAPLTSRRNSHEYENKTICDLVQQLFNPCYQMAGYDSSCGKYLTCAGIFRGLVSSKEVEQAMVNLQAANKESFVNWIPNNIKTAICDIPPKGLSSSATLLANTSAITEVFGRLIGQFDAMFEKKAFVHWYTGEGMDEMEFIEAKHVLVDLCDEYNEASADAEDEDDDVRDDDSCSVCSDCQDPKCSCECLDESKCAGDSWENKSQQSSTE